MPAPKKQSRWPKYKMLPLALALYLAVMSVYGWKRYRLEDRLDQYFIIVGVEVAIIVILYFLLKYQHDRKNRYDEKK